MHPRAHPTYWMLKQQGKHDLAEMFVRRLQQKQTATPSPPRSPSSRSGAASSSLRRSHVGGMDEMTRLVNSIIRHNASLQRFLPPAHPYHPQHDHIASIRRNRPDIEGAEAEVLLELPTDVDLDTIATANELTSNKRQRQDDEATARLNDEIASFKRIRRAKAGRSDQRSDEEEQNQNRIERFVSLNEYDCRICLSRITRTQASVTIPCMHRFCYSCITKWLRNHTDCPICKQKVECLLYTIKSSTDYKVKYYGDASIIPQPDTATEEDDEIARAKARRGSSSSSSSSSSSNREQQQQQQDVAEESGQRQQLQQQQQQLQLQLQTEGAEAEVESHTEGSSS